MKQLLAVFFVSVATLSQAQYFEFGMFGGVSNYQGDLAPVAFKPSETHLAPGMFIKYNFNKFVSIKTSYYHGKISGYDSHYLDPFRQKRNLSFESNIDEISLFGEVYLTGYQPHKKKNLLSPYVFGGVGMFNFNPRAFYNGAWYDLQPLGTEGQGTNAYPDRKPYSLWQVCLPLGLGFKGSISPHWNAGVEFGWRKVFTDYLDDVSSTYVDKEILIAENGLMSWELSNRFDEVNGGVEWLKDDTYLRGDPTDDDWYFFCGFIVSYNLDPINTEMIGYRYYDDGKIFPFRGKRDAYKKMGCPGTPR
jgi:hypothetical protein